MIQSKVHRDFLNKACLLSVIIRHCADWHDINIASCISIRVIFNVLFNKGCIYIMQLKKKAVVEFMGIVIIEFKRRLEAIFQTS